MAKTFLFIVLGAVLTAAVWWAGWVWTSMDGELSGDGNIALILGVVVSLVVGVGLMTLLFRSDRMGYDANVEYEVPEAGKH